jgi:hypothetical protein
MKPCAASPRDGFSKDQVSEVLVLRQQQPLFSVGARHDLAIDVRAATSDMEIAS